MTIESEEELTVDPEVTVIEITLLLSNGHG